ncbi:TerD family protein [Nakamurella flavida]|uniref:TerD family protein n=1 Tax=Nakamurella flavida TaxID=363630 RepID=A0A938YRP9_9ACTN|nr:TerD family protein [Nakamurella flavida]MBM9478212.1 TerD family protein [Nakamurella flavida]MDP9778566.1 tellurium resistance protein TerD [Nakamurella flavida]
MGISLTKGGNLSLTKAAPGLTQVSVGLGWDARTTTGVKFDLDASALGLGGDGRILSNEWFVFFNQKRSPAGAIEHRGDNRTGDGSGDDEVIAVDLSALPPELNSVTFAASVYEAEQNGVSFGQVRNAFIRVVNNSDQSELARYDLTEDASTETAMVFGELYRSGEEWKFRAIGQGYSTGLSGIAADFGVAL